MAEQEKDRTEPATPFKLEEARRRGQVAKSLDFVSLLMLLLFGGVAYLALSAVLPHLLAVVDVQPNAYFGLLMGEITGLIFKLLLVLMLIAFADLAYTRWDYGRTMRMSHREIKEEVK